MYARRVSEYLFRIHPLFSAGEAVAVHTFEENCPINIIRH